MRILKGFDETKRFVCLSGCKRPNGKPASWASYQEAEWHQHKKGCAIGPGSANARVEDKVEEVPRRTHADELWKIIPAAKEGAV